MKSVLSAAYKWARVLLIKTGGGSLAGGVDRVNQVMQSIGATGSFYDWAAPGFGARLSRIVFDYFTGAY